MVAVATILARLPAGWESGGYAVAGAFAVLAVGLIAVGTGLSLMRKLLWLAKVIWALSALTVVVAIGTAIALILAF